LSNERQNRLDPGRLAAVSPSMKAVPVQPCTDHWFQEVEASRISRQLSHASGKVVSCNHRPPLL